MTSRVEHRAGLDACRQLEREGFDVTWLRPRPDGTIEPQQVAEALRPDTALVSLMHANNETGVLTDVAAIAGLCNARGIPLHADAAQSAGKDSGRCRVVRRRAAEFLRAQARRAQGHRRALRAPAAAARACSRSLFGGGHEGGLRSGTLALHQVVGFGAACDAGRCRPRRRGGAPARVARAALAGAAGGGAAVAERDRSRPCPGILNVGFAGIEGESLLLELDGDLARLERLGLQLGIGGAVLRAARLGRSDLAIQASLRLSPRPGARRRTDVDRAAALLVRAVRRLRAALPPGALERIA